MANSTLPLSGAIADYFAQYAYREPAILRELREETAKLGSDAAMQIAPEQGAFMGMLTALAGCRQILEIGTFTGYSSLAMALACDAQLTCVDVSGPFTTLARRFWQKAGVSARITLRLDGGHAAIEDLLKQGRAGTFDACFIDADKTGYDSYYEGGLKLLRKGGFFMIDNVLWGGEVADPAKTDADTNALRALNAKLCADSRVSISMVPIGDGLTLARRIA